MAGELQHAWDIQDVFSSALHFGADGSYETTRTSDTVTTDAVAGSVAIDNTQSTGWSSFFQDTAKALVGYSLAKDARQSGVTLPAANAAAAAQAATPAAQAKSQTLLIVGVAALAVVGVIFALRT